LTRHLAIVGPTASGKSALALAVARAVPGVELVSLDSMQVYRGLDIGTAKPTAAERSEVVHHLVDVADPGEEWSVQRTQQSARAAIADIEARGKRAVLVGGTGLYVRAVIDDLQIPPTDAVVRAALGAAAGSDEGLARAYARLGTLDPAAAARMEPGNRRRIVRALEVIELTGRPFSSFGSGLDTYPEPAISVSIFGLDFDAPALAARIATRVESMQRQGFVEEVRGLVGRPLSRTASEAIGYREMLAHLAGEIPVIADALDAIVRRTRRFARRQRAWFRRDPRVVWCSGSEPVAELARAVTSEWTDAIPLSAATR
jgi:tRNA dimethylallyltransferase